MYAESTPYSSAEGGRLVCVGSNGRLRRGELGEYLRGVSLHRFVRDLEVYYAGSAVRLHGTLLTRDLVGHGGGAGNEARTRLCYRVLAWDERSLSFRPPGSLESQPCACLSPLEAML